MAFEEKNIEGGLFVNRERSKETQPHATGYILINNIKYQLSAWTNTSAGGNKWQKLSAQPWVEKEEDDDGTSEEVKQNSAETGESTPITIQDQGESNVGVRRGDNSNQGGTGVTTGGAGHIDDEIPF